MTYKQYDLLELKPLIAGHKKANKQIKKNKKKLAYTTSIETGHPVQSCNVRRCMSIF